MIETQKGIMVVGIIFCLFITLNCTFGSDYYVNKNTTHKDITTWMNNEAKKGDNLIFNTTSYDLSDTLIINKSVNIKSYKNTEIRFNKLKSMFNVKKSGVNFTGIQIIHSYEGISSVYGINTISTRYTQKIINFKNINLTGNMKKVTLSSNLKKEAKYLLLKTSVFTKKIKIHSMDDSFGGPETYKIKIPKKYANKYYTKTIIVDYYNQNKEHSKKNNIYKFKF